MTKKITGFFQIYFGSWGTRVELNKTDESISTILSHFKCRFKKINTKKRNKIFLVHQMKWNPCKIVKSFVNLNHKYSVRLVYH